MRFGGMGWGGHMSTEERKPARPAGPTLRRAIGLFADYWPLVSVLAVTIAAASLIGLVPPLLIRAIIDDAIPNHDGSKTNLLVAGMIVATLMGSFVGVGQSWL